MLGKLFNLGAASGVGAPPSPQTASHKPVSSLESVQEDIHTRNLLFPDPQDLYEHRLNQVFPLSNVSSIPVGSSSNAFDYNGDIELDVRDVRIIIMQDALGSMSASLLVGHGQRPIVIQPASPKIRQGAFDGRPSVYGRNQGYVESESQRMWREYREELATFSSCIFGNSELMAYKGTSAKVHVVPCETRVTENTAIVNDGRGSIGRSSMRSSRLSQSFSSEGAPPFAMPPTPGATSRIQDRKKILVTRLFPVNLPTDEDVISPSGPFLEDSSGYPFPQHTDDPKIKKKKPQPKQKRIPMYAVALVINLPATSSHSTPAATMRSAFRGPSSYSEQDSFPSSFNSTRPSGWTVVGQGGYGSESFETSFGSDMEDQIDAITQHWDIIMRTLNHLQSVVAAALTALLKQADLSSPDPLPTIVPSQISRNPSQSGRRSEDGPPIKAPKTNAKLVSLVPNCLLDNWNISLEVDAAKTRIVAGIRAARVVTGQNRWPIWREETRWVAKWADGREQDFFFNLLTGFLATHTDWLQALSPASYRRRHLVQQRGRAEEDASVPARTIIMAHDKIAARRLIFLLAAFLPASQQLPGIRTHRPSTSASLGTFSQRYPPPLAHLSMEGRHERRASDAASIRTTHLPMRGSDSAARKSSVATTGTVTPETSIPHFSTPHQAEIFSHGRAGSGISVATDDLKRITREDSGGPHSPASGESKQSSRWGSVISGFWSTRRRDSTASGVKSSIPGSGQNGSLSSPVKPSFNQAGPTSGPMLEYQLSKDSAKKPESSAGSPVTDEGEGSAPLRGEALGDGQDIAQRRGSIQKAQRTPDPSGAFESPVKTSINQDDGVIDVDIPFPDYITSFETAVSSPSSSGYLSTLGFGTAFDAFEQSAHISIDRDIPLNVAGWLQHYHPDFVLQALPVQDGLIEQVKASMRAEPTPPLSHNAIPAAEMGAAGRWVDMSTAIIADASTFTVTRIRYRRFLRPKPIVVVVDRVPPLSTSANTSSPAPLSPVALPSSPYEKCVKEEFEVERLINLDDVLVEAVERVIAVNADGGGSKGGSGRSSRSTSKRRERSNSPSTTAVMQLQSQAVGRHHHHHNPGGLHVPQEVPRSQCKTVVLSALEEIIREVIEEREQEGLGGGSGGREVPVRDKESALREAVRRWLESVESGGGGLTE
ncbi:hypothetical protein B0T17DRAFT_589489 [Bombardia bombarda]|uniref:Folliculin-interacting protein N-terminal domain-containing protein n=1 Tax=Bombardia bombarda TaxID=252184 RepID=A0AA40CA32_9PEZI|nr:hypothetical protein B0T17DRAFT_589489 [Bombardia bombarda]